jgi:hypothetical protein
LLLAVEWSFSQRQLRALAGILGFLNWTALMLNAGAEQSELEEV